MLSPEAISGRYARPAVPLAVVVIPTRPSVTGRQGAGRQSGPAAGNSRTNPARLPGRLIHAWTEPARLPVGARVRAVIALHPDHWRPLAAMQ
eukprot:4442778-Prymnesium_polylepis.1